MENVRRSCYCTSTSYASTLVLEYGYVSASSFTQRCKADGKADFDIILSVHSMSSIRTVCSSPDTPLTILIGYEKGPEASCYKPPSFRFLIHTVLLSTPGWTAVNNDELMESGSAPTYHLHRLRFPNSGKAIDHHPTSLTIPRYIFD